MECGGLPPLYAAGACPGVLPACNSHRRSPPARHAEASLGEEKAGASSRTPHTPFREQRTRDRASAQRKAALRGGSAGSQALEYARLGIMIHNLWKQWREL